jgi:predicted RNA binding protein YcfA (HicA-like mRNA interferase family)
MPNLPHLSGKEIIRALERLGFSQARQRGHWNFAQYSQTSQSFTR